MNILVVSSYVPYPLHSGGQVRLFNLIRELSERHDFTLIAEKRSKQVVDDLSELEKICKKIIIVPSGKQWSLRNMARTATSSHSFLITGHTNEQLEKAIAHELKNNPFDIIHVETFYVMQNLPGFYQKSKILNEWIGVKIPVVLAEHNIEYTVYKKYMARAPVFLKPVLAIDIAKIKKEEKYAWEKATRLVTVSHEDKKLAEKAGLQVALVSNGVNTSQFTFKTVRERRKVIGQAGRKILFIGDYKWIQNRDAVIWIIKEIWPEIKSKIKNHKSKIDTKLWIVGRIIPESIRNVTSDPDVQFDEKSSAKPASEIFQEASILLAPIRIGGGTSYKILESMASGTPVVTTLLSAQAIGADDGKDILVGKTTEELAEKTACLLQDEKQYEKISRNGRELIEKNFTWKNIAKELEKVYFDVVKQEFSN